MNMQDGNSLGTVLHVEDDADARNAMARLLEVSGFRQLAADSAHAALSAAPSLCEELDVLIVDYHLGSHLTGTDVAESLARMIGRALPTVILTGDPANAQIPLLSNAPVWLIRKPVVPDLLISALPSLVGFHRTVRQFTRGHGSTSNWSRSPSHE
jgi:CheY-like chemotaxis protein